MSQFDWEKSKSRLSKILTDGIEEIKDLAEEASYLTDATTHVVKLELEVHRLRTQIEKHYERLGREVVRHASKVGNIKTSETMRKIILNVRKLEATLHGLESEIHQAPFSWSAAKAAVTGKKKASQPATVQKKKVAKKTVKKKAAPKSKADD